MAKKRIPFLFIFEYIVRGIDLGESGIYEGELRNNGVDTIYIGLNATLCDSILVADYPRFRKASGTGTGGSCKNSGCCCMFAPGETPRGGGVWEDQAGPKKTMNRLVQQVSNQNKINSCQYLLS